MATFEQIKAANESIVTTTIESSKKNKETGQYEKVTNEYAQVNQRVKAFRMVHPNGSIETHIQFLNDKTVLATTTVKDENGNLLANGHASENADTNTINKTSLIENAETSSTGRALGLAGFGIDTSICSAEELQAALAKQEQQKQNDKAQNKAPMQQKQESKPNTSKVKNTPVYKPENDTGEMLTDIQKKQILALEMETVVKMLKYYKVETVDHMTRAMAEHALKLIRSSKGNK